MLANPLVWKILAVVAAITLVTLALDDLYYFFTGGKSVIGEFVEYLEQKLFSLQKFLNNEILRPIAGIFNREVEKMPETLEENKEKNKQRQAAVRERYQPHFPNPD